MINMSLPQRLLFSILLPICLWLAGGAKASTSQFNLSNTNIHFGGNWFQNNTGGRSGYIAWTQNPECDFSFTGTQFSFPYSTNGPTTPVTITVDGVATIPTLTASAWTVYTSATLSEGLHVVTIKNTGSQFFFLDLTAGTGGVSVTGAAPALNATTALGTQYVVNNAGATASGFQLLGGWSTITNSTGSAAYQSAWQDVTVSFYATTASFSVYLHNIGTHAYGSTTGTKARLTVDGVDQSQVSTPMVQGASGTVIDSSGGSPQWGFASFTGLDGAAQHLYTVSFSNASRIMEVFSVSVTGTLNTSPTWPSLTYWAAYGDSITEETVGTASDSSLGWTHLLWASRASTYVYNRGGGGSSVSSTFGGANSGESRTADITSLSPAPAKVFILYGTNDLGIGAVPVGTFQTAYQSMMNLLTNGLPTTTFYCMGIIPRGDKTAAQVATYNSAIQSAIAALTAPQQARIIYKTTAAWNLAGASYTGGGSFTATPNYSPLTGGYASDSLHPNPAGNAAIQSQVAKWLASLFRSRSSGGLRPGTRSAN